MGKLLDFITLKTLRERRRAAITEEEHIAEVQQLNSTYSRLFSSDDGMFVLEHLAKMHLVGSIAEQGATYLDIGEKQGRANLVKEIVQRIENAKVGG